MPTRKRRLQEAAAEREASQLLPDASIIEKWEALGFRPSGDLGVNIPWGLVKASRNGDLYLDDAAGSGGNLARHDDKLDTINFLIRKYRSIWGRRGAAKRIAAENGLSERTIQRYFQESKKK